MGEKELYFNFDEYIRQGEPDQKEKAGYWQTAIGLQAVDGLKVSDYLQDTARKHIEGDITIDEARELVNQYYVTKTAHDAHDEDKEEADRVSSNIVKVLSSPTFLSTPTSPPTSKGHTPDKLPDKLPDKFSTNNMYIKKLIEVVGCGEVTIKDSIKMLGLKDRESFMKVYLYPALKERFLRMKYPKSPNHPRQRYLLTVKGQMLYQELSKQ